MPDRLHVAASLKYDGRYERGYLEEQGIRVAGRRITEHGLDLGLQIAPIRGAAVTLDLAMTPRWLWRYPDARQMLLEPVDGGGSYQFATDPDPGGDPVDVSGGGITGVWLGAAFSPFSEAFDLNHRVTWRFDVGYRTASKNHRWSYTDGKRGGALGSSAIKVQGAFSRMGGAAEPYVRARYIKESKVTTDLVDATGTVVASGIELHPASSIEILGGSEVIASKSENGNRTAADFQIGFRYHTWEDLPSGLLLPNVIDASKTIPVTRSERIQGIAGMGVNLVFSDIVRTTTGARFEYTLPHTLEHVYDVQTSPDTFAVSWYFTITGAIGADDLLE